jgi:hypothetical protein
VLHRLIVHFQRAARISWLLIDWDWFATKQAAPFLPSCTDIAVIGRMKWIEGSKHTGKDNFVWARFDRRHTGGPVLHPRGEDPQRPVITPLLSRELAMAGRSV